jgi:hypothetical protein
MRGIETIKSDGIAPNGESMMSETKLGTITQSVSPKRIIRECPGNPAFAREACERASHFCDTLTQDLVRRQANSVITNRQTHPGRFAAVGLDWEAQLVSLSASLLPVDLDPGGYRLWMMKFHTPSARNL